MKNSKLSPQFKYWMKQKGRHPIIAAKAHYIGYLEEYLIVKHGTAIGNDSRIFMRLANGEKFINIRYEQLVAEIEKLDAMDIRRKQFEEGKLPKSKRTFWFV